MEGRLEVLSGVAGYNSSGKSQLFRSLSQLKWQAS
jgi:uridine kinase